MVDVDVPMVTVIALFTGKPPNLVHGGSCHLATGLRTPAGSLDREGHTETIMQYQVSIGELSMACRPSVEALCWT